MWLLADFGEISDNQFESDQEVRLTFHLRTGTSFPRRKWWHVQLGACAIEFFKYRRTIRLPDKPFRLVVVCRNVGVHRLFETFDRGKAPIPYAAPGYLPEEPFDKVQLRT